MTGMSKRVKVWQDKISPVATYPIDEALALVKGNCHGQVPGVSRRGRESRH